MAQVNNMDSVQLVLLIVIILLTILLIVLGVQVFFILRDVRRALGKANKVLDDAGSIAESVQAPITALSSLALGFKASSLLAVAKLIKSVIGHTRDEDENSKHHKKN